VRLLVSASALRPEALKVDDVLPKNRVLNFDLHGRQVLGTAVADFERREDTEMGWIKITIDLAPIAADVAVAEASQEDFVKSPEPATRARPVVAEPAKVGGEPAVDATTHASSA
jgi:hypothetical protein